MPRKYTEAQARASAKWDAQHLEYISIALPKGYRDRLKEVATEQGLTVNKMLRTLLEREYGMTTQATPATDA